MADAAIQTLPRLRRQATVHASRAMLAMFAATTATALIVPRFLPYSLVALFLTFVTALALDDRLTWPVIRFDFLTVSIWSLIFYVALSATWSPQPRDTILTAVILALIVSVCFEICVQLGRWPREMLKLIAISVCLGYVIGLAYLAVDLIGDMPLRRAAQRSFPLLAADHQPGALPRFGYNRNIESSVLLLWPVLLALKVLIQPRALVAVCLGLVCAVVGLAYWSEHETSKVTIVASIATLVLSWRAILPIGKFLVLVWSMAVLAMPPVALALHRWQLQDATWLQRTGQARVAIWSYTAEQIPKAPLLGRGANSTRTNHVAAPPVLTPPSGSRRHSRTTNHHAHNFYLQTWYELGAIGALILLVSGLAIVARITSTEATTRPFCVATFAVFALAGSSSFGIWQTWLIALEALACIAIAVSLAAAKSEAAEPA